MTNGEGNPPKCTEWLLAMTTFAARRRSGTQASNPPFVECRRNIASHASRHCPDHQFETIVNFCAGPLLGCCGTPTWGRVLWGPSASLAPELIKHCAHAGWRPMSSNNLTCHLLSLSPIRDSNGYISKDSLSNHTREKELIWTLSSSGRKL